MQENHALYISQASQMLKVFYGKLKTHVFTFFTALWYRIWTKMKMDMKQVFKDLFL